MDFLIIPTKIMIDYQILADSQKFYEKAGYVSIETPWTVTEAISDITRPIGAKHFKLENRDKVLVASAEQGFLYLYNKGFLPKGKFQSISPCYRDEPFDEYHTKYFIKNELIDTLDVSRASLDRMIDSAFAFFSSCANITADLRRVQTEAGFDILCNEIEIGSYGIRECGFVRWVFGTGIALPRFSRALGA